MFDQSNVSLPQLEQGVSGNRTEQGSRAWIWSPIHLVLNPSALCIRKTETKPVTLTEKNLTEELVKWILEIRKDKKKKKRHRGNVTLGSSDCHRATETKRRG